jgi:hypothetical protein
MALALEEIQKSFTNFGNGERSGLTAHRQALDERQRIDFRFQHRRIMKQAQSAYAAACLV